MVEFDMDGLGNTTHEIVFGDTRRVIKDVDDSSIHLAVTSPPYWMIKDYGPDHQVGHNQTYDEYLDSLACVWLETYRSLAPGCKLIINVGDQFVRASDNKGKYEIKPIHADIIRQCNDIGFTFLGNIIWRKISTTRASGGGAWMGSVYHPRDGYVTYEHEYILILKKEGRAPKPTQEQKETSRLTKEQRSKWFRGVWDDIHPARQKGHIAMFPLELPERLIRMFSYTGERVLDPFLGSGTTSEAAYITGRNSIGIELNRENRPLIEQRLENASVRYWYRESVPVLTEPRADQLTLRSNAC